MSAASDTGVVGSEHVLEIGPVAHGGHMVARLHEGEDQRVVFVRHALPGEQARVRITEDGGRFLRGDAVEILTPSPDRVEAPCVLARPYGCGGCDFQHVSLPAQRELKAAVVREQLSRLAGLDVDVTVEAVPGDNEGLRWRTRMQYVRLPDGRRGLRKHRSHDVVPVDDCLIAHPAARVPMVEPVETKRNLLVELVETKSGTHRFAVESDGFWQVHPGAPTALVEAVLDMLQPQPGEKVLDLYSGVGLFTAFLVDAVTSSGEVVAVEGDRRAVRHAATNLADQPWVEVRSGGVEKVLARGLEFGTDSAVDLVVLDPPRNGARKGVVEQVAARHPRAIAYVACDPAALARDIAYFAEVGYRLESIRAFDLFPMTHHVECVALLTVPAGG